MAGEVERPHPDDVTALESPDGLSDAERAQWADMQSATVDSGTGADDAGAGGAADGAAGGDQGAAGGTAGGQDQAGGQGGAQQQDQAARQGVPGQQAAKDGVVAAEGADDEDDEDDDAVDGVAAQGGQQQGQGDRPGRKQRVSARKWKAEQARAETAERELGTMREKMARFDERFAILNEALGGKGGQQAQQEDQDPEPDAEKDIFEWVKWSKRETGRLRDQINGVQQGRQTDNFNSTITDSYRADAASFAQKQPDFGDAYRHLMAARYMQLAVYMFDKDVSQEGVRLSPEEDAQIRNEVASEERSILVRANKSKRSPAKMIYDLSRSLGYRPQQQQNGAGGDAAQGGGPGAQGGQQQNGAQRQNGAAQQTGQGQQQNGGKKPTVKEEIEKLQNGVDASLSLSDGGGSAGQTPLNAQRFAEMSQEEFNRLADTMSPEDWAKIAGGV